MKGVAYLTRNVEDMTAYEKIIDLLKDQDDGSVTQRFCIAALQKTAFIATKNGTTKILEAFNNKGLIEWVSKFIERSRMRQDVSPFCIEFSSALLANLFTTQVGLDYLQKNQKLVKDTLTIILGLLKEKITPAVLWHMLIAISLLAKHKEMYSAPFEDSQFAEKITDFQEFYSHVNPNGKEFTLLMCIDDISKSGVDKKSILDLCTTML